MILTKWTNMPLEEFIHVLEDRSASPLIDECVQRLQKMMEEKQPCKSKHVPCPICDAMLEINYDPTQRDEPFDIEPVT